MEEFVADTVTSVFEQTHDPIEVIVVNDGSFRPEDAILASLATQYPLTVLTQPNAGLSAARNFGICQSRGAYVLPLDADNMIEPEFVARCVEALQRDPAIAYVTSWSRYIDADGRPLSGPHGGYQPLGNSPRTLDRGNIAGDAAAVIRRSVFTRLRYADDLRSYEDWVLYRQMREAGLIGHVIPERLLVYRLREDSMLRTTGLPRAARLEGEMRAHLRAEKVQWTS
jgi:glycosyltransferase involved in cell wall biosynthesis